MNNPKCKYCGYQYSKIDIKEIKEILSQIGYCPLCHKEINLKKLKEKDE